MKSEEKRLLWLNSTRSRYFLIPENQELPSGDFTLYTLTGKEKSRPNNTYFL